MSKIDRCKNWRQKKWPLQDATAVISTGLATAIQIAPENHKKADDLKCNEQRLMSTYTRKTSRTTRAGGVTQPDCMECATRTNCLIGNLSAEDRFMASSILKEGTFRSGAEISLEGDNATTLKIIKVGTVFGYRTGRDGHRRPIGIAGRGATFGLYGCFDKPNQITGIAVSSGRTCELSIRHIKEETSWSPAFRDELIYGCMRSHEWTADWSVAMRLRTVVKQLAYALHLLSGLQGSPVIQLPTHTTLAELLGTTRETIVRGLVTLEEERCLTRLERKKCHVFAPRILEWLGSA